MLETKGIPQGPSSYGQSLDWFGLQEDHQLLPQYSTHATWLTPGLTTSITFSMI